MSAPRSPSHPQCAALLALAALLLAAAGCSDPLSKQLVPNQRPVVRLTHAPVDTTQAEFYTYKLYWVGFDPDGRVVRFEYAVDPPSDAGLDTAWVSTTDYEQIFHFSASEPVDVNALQPLARDFHVFVIRAVDNRGLRSAPVSRAFYSFGVAPVVSIDEPSPSALLSPSVFFFETIGMNAGEGLHQRRFAVIVVAGGANDTHEPHPYGGTD